MKKEMDETDNSSVFRIAYKRVITGKQGGCDFCPWHRWENAYRHSKHGHRKLNKIPKLKRNS